MKFSAKLRRGFTLIELLIVIVIIGILAVGLVPKVIDAPKKARDTVRKTDLNAIKIAVESFYADNNAYPAAATFTALGSLAEQAKLKAYFQGTAFPTANTNPATIYYYMKDPTAGTNCYVIGAIMESSNAGNSALDPSLGAAVPTCATVAAASAGAGKYQYITGGSF